MLVGGKISSQFYTKICKNNIVRFGRIYGRAVHVHDLVAVTFMLADDIYAVFYTIWWLLHLCSQMTFTQRSTRFAGYYIYARWWHLRSALHDLLAVTSMFADDIYAALYTICWLLHLCSQMAFTQLWTLLAFTLMPANDIYEALDTAGYLLIH